MRPPGEEDRARREGGGELGVVGCDDHRGPGGGAGLERARELRLGGAVHAAGRLVEAEHGGFVGGDQGEREALALAAREVARLALAEVLETSRL